MRAVGDEMDIRPKDLKIAYRFNFWTQKEPLRLLSTEKHLAGLFVVARKELQERVDKKTKRSKELEVTIADVRDKEEKLKKGKGKEKRKAPPVRKSTHSSDGSDDDDLRPPRKKSGAEFLRELHSKHKCELHSSFCLIAKNGEHIALSDQKMSLWSMLLSEKAHSSITEPPPQLQLSMDNGSHTVPAGRNRRTDNNNQQPSVPFAYYPPPPGYMPPHAYPSYYHPVPPPPPAAPQPSASKPSSSTLHHASSIDSQDDDNITFPKMDDWLRELNAADEDGHQFDSFAPALHANGFMRVYQLADERDGVGLLTKICPEIKIGTASLLVKRAKKECNTLRRLEKQRKIDWAS
ncbi:hypothetical protein C8R45DRAFT_1026837 [Mycena sanguinolenta]|nr:hypothetical protein C8R45DRAFT_1026837 [Mycena sanguinolenta]